MHLNAVPKSGEQAGRRTVAACRTSAFIGQVRDLSDRALSNESTARDPWRPASMALAVQWRSCARLVLLARCPWSSASPSGRKARAASSAACASGAASGAACVGMSCVQGSADRSARRSSTRSVSEESVDGGSSRRRGLKVGLLRNNTRAYRGVRATARTRSPYQTELVVIERDSFRLEAAP